MRKRAAWFIGIILAVVFGLFIAWSIHETPPPAKVVKTAPPISRVPQPISRPSAAQVFAEKLKLGTIGNREGFEHPIIRQLVSTPASCGYSGDVSQAGAVTAWAQHKADLVAVRTGFHDWKFRGEVRFKHPGQVAYVVECGGGDVLQVSEYAVSGSGTQSAPRNVQMAGSYLQAQFLGTPGSERLQPYQYLYTGGGQDG